MARSLFFSVVFAAGMFSFTLAAEPTKLEFRAASETSVEFDTGVFRGSVRLDGKSQGIPSLIHIPTGINVAAEPKLPGLLSYYRIFSTGKRYTHAARDWPVTFKILEDGALRIAFAPAPEHPLELTGTFRWSAPDTLDLETTVTPQVDLPKFEVFLSSYLAKGYEGSVYLKPNRYSKTKPTFIRTNWSELTDGNYLIFPRELTDLPMIYDGRWEIGPSPVTWAFSRYLEAPVGVRRNAENGLAIAWMARPEDCFAIALPYNKQPPDGVSGHESLYLSLFGRDLPADQTATARCRMIVGKDLTDEVILDRYQAYAAEVSNPK